MSMFIVSLRAYDTRQSMIYTHLCRDIVSISHSRWYCVYRDCYGLSPLKTIYKDFHFQFEVDFTCSPNSITIKSMNLKSLHVEIFHYVLGNRGIIVNPYM